jgi:C1A family cysteine protease
LTSFDRRTVIVGSMASGLVPKEAFSQLSGTPRHGGGWIPDRPDPRDRLLALPQFAEPAPRPSAANLSAKLPPAYDQGSLGSCTANAIAAAVQYARRVHHMPDDFVPSRLFIYYQQRVIEQSVMLDLGGQLRDGIMSITDLGVCPESDWPYDSVGADRRTRIFPPNARAIQAPPLNVMQTAKRYKTISLAPLTQSVEVLESCIARGYPFIFGFSVYGQFDEATTILRKPKPTDVELWGHAAMATGYDQRKRIFRIRNSWGQTAHDKGYFDMDYDYVLNPTWAKNFWVVYQTSAFL